MKLHNEVKSEREGSEPEQQAYYLKGIGTTLFEMALAWLVIDKHLLQKLIESVAAGM